MTPEERAKTISVGLSDWCGHHYEYRCDCGESDRRYQKFLNDVSKVIKDAIHDERMYVAKSIEEKFGYKDVVDFIRSLT